MTGADQRRYPTVSNPAGDAVRVSDRAQCARVVNWIAKETIIGYL